MVSRKQKLLAAGAVLALGFTMAMLFPNGGEQRLTVPPLAGSPARVTSASAAPANDRTVLDGQFSPLAPLAASSAGLVSNPNAGHGGSPAVDSLPLAPQINAPGVEPTFTPPPATLPTSGGEGTGPSADPAATAFRIHVVNKSDTLERIAERYLGDGGRALELFDLNRDLLENPHLLPIGAQLRIPGAATTERD